MRAVSRNIITLVFLVVITSTVHSKPLKQTSTSSRQPNNVRNNNLLQIMQNKQRDFFTPSHTRTAMLYNKLGFYLAVDRFGVLRGTSDTFCRKNYLRCLFRLESFGTSLVRIKNSKTRRYIAIDRKGKVYTTKQRKQETLLYQRLLSTGFTVFWSYVHQGRKHKSLNWYIGIKRSGAVKNASKTTVTHKSGHFFVIYK